MINFPITIVDNFLENPDKIRNFALHQEFFKSDKIPGKRTKLLSEIDPYFCNELMKKFFSLYYDFDYQKIEWNVDASFQLIDCNYNEGWVHQDESKITGIIYLNKNSNLKTGTSIYKTKQNILNANLELFVDKKHSFFKGNISYDDAEMFRKQNNDQFDEVVNISNIYNRLISFESDQYHSAQSFINDNKEPRLTLIFFVNKIFSKNTPIEKSKFYKI